jgi:fructose-1-phosphate kinase PfkB-like protein
MIVVPGFSLALDVLLRAEASIGAVVRADESLVVPGGKALNVAYYAGAMGAPVHLIALAVDWMTAPIGKEVGSSTTVTFVQTAVWPRIDVSVVSDGGKTTTINSPPPPIPDEELDAALARTSMVIGNGDILVVAGLQPPGIVDQLMAIGATAGARVILDTSGPDLARGIRAGPEIVKVTAEEFAAAYGLPPQEAWERGRSFAPEPETLVITAGAAGARAWSRGAGMMEVRPPEVNVVNTLGAGDALTAALAAAVERGGTLREGLVVGTAWAADAVQSLSPRVDGTREAALKRSVRVALREGV